MVALIQPGKEPTDEVQVASVSEAIRLVRSMIEEKFLAMGESLESSTTILARLTETFQGLLAKFDSDDLKQAVEDVSTSASRVVTLSGAYHTERGALEAMSDAAASIEDSVARMHAAIKAVDMLGISAKIEATHIDHSSSDFRNFANEIDRSLRLAQTNLAKLTNETSIVRDHLVRANIGESRFDAQHGEALRRIPQRLSASVESIATHRDRAVQAASAVADLSSTIAGRIGEAVMALQIGDTARQRIEHVETALDLVDRLVDGHNPSYEIGPAEWQQLSEFDRRRLVAFGYRLQSAQLSDIAFEFEGEVERITASLRDLVVSATDIARLGESAYGGSGGRDDTFLFELESDVQHARQLLDGFRAAREEADSVVAAVTNAAARLADHVEVIHSLEADLRIVGLNTSFKCGRLGLAGRPLSIIAQELRACSRITAGEADGVMESLARMLDGVTALKSREQTGRELNIAAVAKLLTEAVDRLGSAARALSRALAALSQDSEAVTALLDDAVRRITVHEEIAGVLRQASADLLRGADEADLEAGSMPLSDVGMSAQERMLAMISTHYTMAQERQVHIRIAGKTAQPEAASEAQSTTTVETSLDDMLF